MTRVEVRLDPAYDVVVGRGAVNALRVPHRRAAVLVDEAVLDSVGARAAAALEAGGSRVDVLALPAGEAAKTLEVFARAVSWLAARGFTRDAAVVAVGGGAASDAAGFVASAFLRGIAFYVVPTTLLAMVDASVGGKTGVNLPEGKNLVGAFHQPRGVTADLDALVTLPDAVFREGAAEVFKHGLLADAALCDAVLEPGFDARAANLERVVASAVRVKAGVVSRDPLERGERAHLNFGHTLAHALEAVTHHALPHGEAVGYGMHFAALLGRELGFADVTARTAAFLAYQRPRPLPSLALEDVAPFMARDKKADADGVRFVLLEDVARPVVTRVPDAALRAAWAAFQSDVAARGLAAGRVG